MIAFRRVRCRGSLRVHSDRSWCKTETNSADSTVATNWEFCSYDDAETIPECVYVRYSKP